MNGYLKIVTTNSMKILSLLLLVVFGVECEVMSSEEKPISSNFIDMAELYIRNGFQPENITNGKFLKLNVSQDFWDLVWSI